MQNMAKDMGFFSIVWGILILASSTAMLGALHYPAEPAPGAEEDHGDADLDTCGADKAAPMRSWSLWWIIRTYMQSLGQVCQIGPLMCLIL